ncbi:cytochrome C [Sulfuricaulis limicola]|uniref:Cytochrome C n=1 Tax=Sulfuricaulis limicola TaxID=1620215 RepID=A0A1B4XI12_9GAMM|nr:4Fe-4S dicluster domain-containing protein [Sulfuricaulis limicola]BAV34416.1 cytochrome C [Sulfuricaulis limicola]
MEAGFLPRAWIQALLDALHRAGYRCVGPQVRDGAIVYDTLDRAGALPQGVRDRQGPGQYRLETTASPRYFSWANGPQALKPFLFAPHEVMWRAERDARGAIRFSEIMPAAEMLAVIGARACDLAALRLQDRHFLQGKFADPYYAARRKNLFLVAVHCTHPADTCFCASTGDGPRATQDFDIALDELDDGYLVQAGSDQGSMITAQLPLAPTTDAQRGIAEQEAQEAARRQTRGLPSRNLRDVLFANLEHPRWENVAERCLSCGNCTAVCPTCFCHGERDVTALDNSHSEHARQWDSCFTQGHSYIHGMTIRADTRMRYRQWLTHKLGSWHDQYGRSGCVGCGRCIAWCPVGIDITEEARAIGGGGGHG